MKRLKFFVLTLTLAIFTTAWPGPGFAQIEQAVIQIEGGMQ